MKKSIIWLLTIIMALTFGALLYFQIMYLERMVKMREAQFSENVRRSLYATAGNLEKQETLRYLEDDVMALEDSYNDYGIPENEEADFLYNRSNPSPLLSLSEDNNNEEKFPANGFGKPTDRIPDRFIRLQESLRNQYRYQKRLLNEVILTIMREANAKPVMQRADSASIKYMLKRELANNGLDVPFEFAVSNENGIIQYSSSGFKALSAGHENDGNVYSQGFFSVENPTYYLTVTFPTKSKYVFRSVRFIIPTLAFTAILLVVFLYTIILAFRQKKLSEMKNDFINNMTHELKTPIATISLASQMLNDESVKKAPSMLRHISKVITEEAKRLRIQVERVLVLSMFDNSQFSIKYAEVNANEVIANVIQTFKLRVEKAGGKITFDTETDNADVYVDEMHLTNVIFTILDNAVKYRNEERPLEINIKTLQTDNGANLAIKVSDNGIGIKKDDLKHIFERFYRVSTGNRHNVKGFGIGLAYVRQIINHFGGTVYAESEIGKGTSFTISLPLVNENNN